MDIAGIMAAKDQQRKCQYATYACLEQPETLKYLNFLKLNEDEVGKGLCISFNSEIDDVSKQSKKNKKFQFDGIYQRTEKFKHQFSKLIKDVACDALKGQSQSFFAYGTQETCKDKLLFGESQNPGLFPCILSEIFDICHQKALENNVTVKFSCSLFNKAKFIDIFGGNSNIEFSKDPVQGGVLHGVPQIIIRNIKTGLKLLNIVLKQVNDLRQQQKTQNIILTLKLQLDCIKVRGQTTDYCISKICFIKLANPSINSSLKGVNKNNVWFVNLINFLQGISMSNAQPDAHKQNEKADQFTEFMKETIFKSSHKTHGFISITNKMSSNQCLTALLFANYLKNSNSNSRYFVISLPKIYEERNKNNKIIHTLINKNKTLFNLWADYIGSLVTYMKEINYLEFEYSIVIGQACERLSKYIFTEELEDFYYAKRTNIDKSNDLLDSADLVFKLRHKIEFLHKKFVQKTEEAENKKFLSRFLSLQFALAHHFLVQDLEKIQTDLNFELSNFQNSYTGTPKDVKDSIPNLESAEINQSKQNEESENIISRVNQMKSTISKSMHKTKKYPKEESQILQQNSMINASKAVPKRANKSIDNLQGMFKNKNVGFTGKSIK